MLGLNKLFITIVLLFFQYLIILISMNFSKDQKKYYLNQIKGNISNYFNFTSKSLNNVSAITQQPPILCAKCHLPLLASICSICKTDNNIPSDTQFKQNFVYIEKLEDQKMEESLILLVDMSGSMVKSYKSKYKKVNEDLVKRVLGEANYSFLFKKLGKQKLFANYLFYQMLLNQGDTAKQIVEMIKHQQGNKTESDHTTSKKQFKNGVKQQQQIQDYISRKQIIQITISKCLNMMKNMHPQTQITIVYFNDSIQIPVDFFNSKITISGIQHKNVQEMIQLGVEYSNKISKAKANNIGQNLIMNLTKTQQKGTTALGPALAFCFGLAKSFKCSLHQIVVVTDGLSNIGFGQTQNYLQHEQVKRFYQDLALRYAKSFNCVVDFIAFQDQCIGYEVVDQLVQITGGIPCQIQFTKFGGENVATDQTFDNISFKLRISFDQYISKLNFQTKTIIKCLNEKVKLKLQSQLDPFIYQDKQHTITLKTGIKSGDYSYHVQFSIPPQTQEFDKNIKFMIINQYKKKNKKYLCLTTQKIKILQGTKQQAEKEEAAILQKQIKNFLKPRQIFEEDINRIKKLSLKIQQFSKSENNFDQQLLKKFNTKKEQLQQDIKNTDKFTRQKMHMKSRAQKTYKKIQNEENDDDDWK